MLKGEIIKVRAGSFDKPAIFKANNAGTGKLKTMRLLIITASRRVPPKNKEVSLLKLLP